MDAVTLEALARSVLSEEEMETLQRHRSVNSSMLIGPIRIRVNAFYDSDGIAMATRALDINVPRNPFGAEPDQDPRMVEVFERWHEAAAGLVAHIEPSGMSQLGGEGGKRELQLGPDRRASFWGVPPGVYAVTVSVAPKVESWRRVVVQPGATVTVRLPAP